MQDRTTTRNKLLKNAGLVLGNLFKFLCMMVFITIFQALFGAENILIGVAISVGLTMFPTGYTGIRRGPTVFTILVLYVGGALLSETALLSPWLALPLNFLFLVALLALSMEPELMKPSISFLLTFIFGQATPVPWEALPKRLASALAGALFVAAWTYVAWRRHGYGGPDARTLRQQCALCVRNRAYILRMSIGVSFAMLAGMLLHLKKPLWISIVVMSLTQMRFDQTRERIKYRSFGTVVGAVLFILIFRVVVPEQYGMAVILLLGYLSYFTTAYQYKQIVNAMNALFAAMVLLDTGAAILNRVLCLAAGIVIVLGMYGLEHVSRGRLDKTRLWSKYCRNPESVV